MKRTATDHSIPCFAFTVPGLERIAAAEIEETLGGDVRKQAGGQVVFRVDELTRDVFDLRTVEDVFLFAWGSDKLTYRATDLDLIQRWTAKEPNWLRLTQLATQLQPKGKLKPTFRLVTQMRGEHGYRRFDAAKAFAKGLAGRLPAYYRQVDEDAFLEIWLTIHGKRALCGVRLTDRRMRHREYKEFHRPASLRPVVAAAMVRLADLPAGEWLVDPMCGVGTILGEQLLADRRSRVLGGDADRSAVYAAYENLRRWRPEPCLAVWDATELPLPSQSVGRLVCNPPFGRQVGEGEDIPAFYQELVEEWHRVLKPGGKAVVIVGDAEAFQKAAWPRGWIQEDRHALRLLGNPCEILGWRAPYA